MEDLFNPMLPNGQRPDIYLCIFPHLKEFLAIDLREGSPQVRLLNASEVFTQSFFQNVEAEFSHALRQEADFPFDHLINLPLQIEETIRDVAIISIMERLGVQPHDEELPSVLVFVVSGGALAMQSEQLLDSLKGLLAEVPEKQRLEEWEGLFSRLVAAEQAALQRVNQQELGEALSEESPDFFTLWERRN
jgi:hypothetical protein